MPRIYSTCMLWAVFLASLISLNDSPSVPFFNDDDDDDL